jgi:hypothetical protein
MFHPVAQDMGIIGSYRDLDVWAASMDLVDGVFRHSQALPRQDFELRSQMKRAVNWTRRWRFVSGMDFCTERTVKIFSN